MSVLPLRGEWGGVSWNCVLRFEGLQGGLGFFHFIRRFPGEVFVCPEGFWVLEQGEGTCHLFRLAACESFGLMYLADGDC